MFYHGTNSDIPESFKVEEGISSSTYRTLSEEYSLDDLEGGLFVTDNPELAEMYGNKIYEIETNEEPLMIDNGIYIIPLGEEVRAKRIK